MSLLRRSPRTVYRVYSEDDYLAEAESLAGWQAQADRDAPDVAEIANARAIESMPASERAPDVERTPAVEQAPAVEEEWMPAAEHVSAAGRPAARTGRPTSATGLRLRRLTVGAALAAAVGVVGAAIGMAIPSGGRATHRALVKRVMPSLGAGPVQAPDANAPVPPAATGRRPAHPEPERPAAKVARSTTASRILFASRRPAAAPPESGAPASPGSAVSVPPESTAPTPLGSAAPAGMPEPGSEPGSESGSEPEPEPGPYAQSPPATGAEQSTYLPSRPPQLDAQIEFGFER